MGYQESYVTTKDQANFVMLERYIFNKMRNDLSCAEVEVVETITLNEPIKGTYANMCHPEVNYEFDAGSKFLYVVGERRGQRSVSDLLLLDYCPPTKAEMEWIKDVQIIYTECFPSDNIFGLKGTPIATHELVK